MKRVHVVGGGTRAHIDSHLYLGSKARGRTARTVAGLFREKAPELQTVLHLTNMADPISSLDTAEDMGRLVDMLVNSYLTKIVVWTPAMVDFVPSAAGIYANGRLSSRYEQTLSLKPAEKLIHRFRRDRKDIFLVGFKQTNAVSEDAQYLAGLNLLKEASCNLVLCNDATTRKNMIVVPEEAAYCVTFDRDRALRDLVDMALLRSHLTFTRSTVVEGEPVAWSSELVPTSLRRVVDHCIGASAYKPFRGSTAGHFAVKLDETTFLTSRRKTDFNHLDEVGLVKIKTDGPDSVIAYGSKPSVGGQSQRIVFAEHPEADCIVHFHCEKRSDSVVPAVSQREFECGSHECGQNTSTGLKRFGNLLAVHLDRHGPNIVFHRDIDPVEVISFIEKNFDLSKKTGGYQL